MRFNLKLKANLEKGVSQRSFERYNQAPATRPLMRFNSLHFILTEWTQRDDPRRRSRGSHPGRI